MSQFLTIFASIFSVYGYYTYYSDLNRKQIKPNRWSWLIWSFATSLETITYNEISGDIVKVLVFSISCLSCLVITLAVWKKSIWEKPDWTEIFSVSTCFIALILWLVFNSALWAHVILLVSLPIAFIPTYRSAYEDYKTENSKAWLFWTIGDILIIGLVLFRLSKNEELGYAMIEFICHALVLLIVFFRKRKDLTLAV